MSRPRVGDAKRQSVTVRLPPDVLVWLDAQGRRKGRVIEEALRKEMQKSLALTQN